MPTETTAPRLIDANALLDRIATMYAYVSGGIDHKSKKQFDTTVSDFIYLVNDAPTVETTDDVMNRLPERCFIWKRNSKEFWAGEMYENSNGDVSIDFPKIEGTETKALKKLEASLKTK